MINLLIRTTSLYLVEGSHSTIDLMRSFHQIQFWCSANPDWPLRCSWVIIMVIRCWWLLHVSVFSQLVLVLKFAQSRREIGRWFTVIVHKPISLTSRLVKGIWCLQYLCINCSYFHVIKVYYNRSIWKSIKKNLTFLWYN